MENQRRLTIDGNEATFEITDAPQAMVGADRIEIDPLRPILVVTTMRDGKKVWSGIGSREVTDGIPLTQQFTTEQLTEIYQQARRRWYGNLLESPLFSGPSSV
jgi:hypothetical protein